MSAIVTTEAYLERGLWPQVTKGVPKKREKRGKKGKLKKERRGIRETKVINMTRRVPLRPTRGFREENFRGAKLLLLVRATFFNFAPGHQNLCLTGPPGWRPP